MGVLTDIAPINGVTSSAQILVSQLLPTGGILCHFNDASNWIFEPDHTGSYPNGRARRIADSPFTSLCGSIAVQNDGTVRFYPGEYGTSWLSNPRIMTFNPFTETWTSVSTTTGDAHVMIAQRDDGTYFGPIPREDPLILQPNGDLCGQIGGSVPGGGDGRLLRVTPGGTQTTLTPTYPAASWIGNARWVPHVPSVDYEPGVMVYMPRLDRNVMISGLGAIFVHDRTNDTLTRPCNIGIYEGNEFALGTVGAPNNGQNTTAVTAGSLHMVVPGGTSQYAADLNSAASKYVYVTLGGNTSVVALQYTSASWDNATSSVIFNGLSKAGMGTNTATFTTGDRITAGRPYFAVLDQPACITPNGDVIFSAGIQTVSVSPGAGSGFNDHWALFRWDGTSTPPTRISPLLGTNGNFCNLFPCPDGTIWNQTINGTGLTPGNPGAQAGVRFYIPTGPELTAHHRPSITAFPPVVTSGQQVALSGTQLNGLHEGGYFGDDGQPRTNFPIVAFRNTSTGIVYYATTKDYTYRGIEPGRASQCNVVIPEGLPFGRYEVRAISSGNASDPVILSVTQGGAPIAVNQRP
jgi:hypothetical protein